MSAERKPSKKRAGATAAAGLAKMGDAPSAPPFAPELDGAPHPLQGAETADQGPPSGVEQPRPVRMTVVLGPVEYDRLQAFTHEAQRATGRRGVASSEVTRLALARVLGDEALRAELVETITREGGNRRREGGKRTRS